MQVYQYNGRETVGVVPVNKRQFRNMSADSHYSRIPRQASWRMTLMACP